MCKIVADFNPVLTRYIPLPLNALSTILQNCFTKLEVKLFSQWVFYIESMLPGIEVVVLHIWKFSYVFNM